MAKWADYGISAKQMNAEKTHIVKVKVHVVNNDNAIGSGTEWLRTKVVSAIEASSTFVTIVKNAKGDWTKGAVVRIEVINGVKYIRTDSDQTTKDNLDNLPDF